MKIKNIEYRAMADGKHKAVRATVIEDDGSERRATVGEMHSVEGFRTAAARFLRDHGISIGGLLASPELRAKFERDRVAILYEARGGRLLAGCSYNH